MMKPLPSQEFLKAIFEYNPDEGVLRFRARADRPSQWNGRWSGRAVGNVHDADGRSKVMIDGSMHFVHRVIWKWMTGSEPVGLIDHRDGDPRNNRWSNLRQASDSQNAMNRRNRRGRALPKGVYWHKVSMKFAAQIGAAGASIHLGVFDTVEAAQSAYANAAARLHKEFARTT